jgi:hypothetical protein
VWDRLHRLVLDELPEAELIDWSRGCVDSMSVRPRRRPEKLHADNGYDYSRCRRYLHQRGIKVRITRRAVESSSHLGRVRWVGERTISWLLRVKRATSSDPAPPAMSRPRSSGSSVRSPSCAGPTRS